MNRYNKPHPWSPGIIGVVEQYLNPLGYQDNVHPNVLLPAKSFELQYPGHPAERFETREAAETHALNLKARDWNPIRDRINARVRIASDDYQPA